MLGEVRGTAPISYLDQPYLPDAAAFAPLPPDGTWLAFLDVWDREVTCLVDPHVVEQAVAVDTTTRRQTAWQVRFAEAAVGDTCDSPNPAYDALTAPSDGRLTTGAVGVPASTDPCTIAPFGGYRGLENRLYRVEIHDPGPLGTATFKWSRDNASLGASVLVIDAGRTTLTLSRLGRDGVKRIVVGDWIEVTDDHHELHRLPGELRQVITVDEVRAEVTAGARSERRRLRRHRREAPHPRHAVGRVGACGRRRRRYGRRPGRRARLAGGARGRHRGALRRRRRRRNVPGRRSLGVRRTHRRRLGRGARGGAAARRPAPPHEARDRHVPRDGHRLPPDRARWRRRLRLRVRPVRHAGVARERRANDPGCGQPAARQGRQDLPADRRLPRSRSR